MVVVIGIVIGLAVGAGLAFLSLYAFAGSRLAAARRTRQLLVTEAKREADSMRREAQSESDALRREGQIEAREASVRLRAEIEQEVAERRAEILKIEERVLAKEEDIDQKLTELTRREQGVCRPRGAHQAAAGRAQGGARLAAHRARAHLGHDRQRGQGAPARALRGARPPRARPPRPPGRRGGTRRGQAPRPQPRRRRAAAGGREPCLRDHRLADRAALGRHEGPHHRPRRAATSARSST